MRKGTHAFDTKGEGMYESQTGSLHKVVSLGADDDASSHRKSVSAV